VVWLVCYVFVSLGLWASAFFPTPEVAQAIIGLIIPLAFLFGGLYLQKPLIPNGASNGHQGIYWLWAYYADPISYSLEALLPTVFKGAEEQPSLTNHSITIVGAPPVNTYAYVARLYDIKDSRRWGARILPPALMSCSNSRRVRSLADVGCLVAFIAGLQFLHLWSTRFSMHASR